MTGIAKAIQEINSAAEFSVNANDTNQITWLNGTTPISVTDIQAKITELKNAEPLNNLRKERTEKLKESDWMANSDVTMSSNWTTYRQALRDLPANYSTSDSAALSADLSNLVWPTKPE
jgi:hypothetical protein